MHLGLGRLMALGDAEPRTRFYGGNGTIHRNTELDVETTKDGQVVSVWFRCQELPFRQTVVSSNRASEMMQMTARSQVELHGVTVMDPDAEGA